MDLREGGVTYSRQSLADHVAVKIKTDSRWKHVFWVFCMRFSSSLFWLFKAYERKQIGLQGITVADR